LCCRVRQKTPYYYLTFEEIEKQMVHVTLITSIVTDKKENNRFGSGPNRIGQGIEFDYSVRSSCRKRCGYETIMINCNPETV
jgi:carbamoyl-phosphate synthase large subunit